MEKIFIISIFLVLNSALFAQRDVEQIIKYEVNNGSDTIVISNSSKGIRYSMNGVMLQYDKFNSLFSKNTEAQREFEIVKNYKLYATILTIGGSGFLLYGISNYLTYENELSSTKPSTRTSQGSYGGPLIIGLSAIAASFPLVIGSKIHLRKAVFLYNQSINARTSQNMYMKLGIVSNGVGFELVF